MAARTPKAPTKIKPPAEPKGLEVLVQVFEHALPVQGIYMGGDLSLTSTGLAILLPGRLVSLRILTHDLRGVARLRAIQEAIMTVVMDKKPLAVCLEGYSFGSTSKAHSLGELGGVMKLSLGLAGVPTFIAPPQTLKKSITGKGNEAGKGPMMLDIAKLYGIEIRQDDRCDAAAAAIVCALVAGGLPTDTLSLARKDGLRKVEALPPVATAARPRPRSLEGTTQAHAALQRVQKVATGLQTA